jgi:hypothetical protein
MRSGVRVRAVAAAAVAAAIVGLFVGLRGGGTETATPPASHPPGPPTTGEFADSVGVNIHLTHDTTPYSDFERVFAALQELGVRHVRDGLVPARPDQYERLNRLAQAGIRSTLILGAPSQTQVGDLVRTLKAELRAAVEAVEGPNEYDLSGDPGWADSLRSYQRELYAAVKSDAALRELPVYAPTIVVPQNRELLRDLGRALDVANIHPYAAGGPPEPVVRQEIADAGRLVRTSSIVATETGYHNAINAEQGQPPVDEATVAEYLPRLFLSAFAEGIDRTYWYELVDLYPDEGRMAPDAHFGLLRTDFSRKPAFTALANLMRLVGDTSPRQVPSRALKFSLSEQVGRLLLQKAEGVYLLALWRDAMLFDPAARHRIDQAPATVRVGLRRPAAEVGVYRPTLSADPIQRLRDEDTVSVPLAGDAVILELRFPPA